MTTRSPDSAELRLREQARSLPYEEPDEGRMEQMRRAVVRGAPARHPGQERLLLAGAAALIGACAALAIVGLRTPPLAHPLLAHVTPLAGARLEHLVQAEPPPAPWTERVRLQEGGAWFDVDPLGPRESFAVLAGDGVVEVRGTRFFCLVEGGKLVQVAVEHGRVEVRPSEGPSLSLGPGETWSLPPRKVPAAAMPPAPPPAPRRSLALAAPRPSQAPPEPPAQLEPPTPAPAPAPQPPPGPQLRPEERAFTDGWEALRGGDAHAAAAHFAEVPPGDALGEDAAYWTLVAQGRLGGATAASLRAFLKRWPASVRRGEVNLMLGLRLLADGDTLGAQGPLTQAAQDPSVRLAEVARQALQSISSPAAPAGP